MNDGYPLLLDVTGRRVAVVGGGNVGTRRAVALADAGAEVTVIAPNFSQALQADKRIALVRRAYRNGDLAEVWLVHACTGIPAVDDAVAREAEQVKLWCVRASSSARSKAWTPAVARIDDVVVAVNAGGDPRRARSVRDAIALLLTNGDLPSSRHRVGAGRVALVGGGPGDPGLITVRGRRLLAQADVVVVDRLAPQALIDELAPDVQVIDASKQRDRHTLTQDEINDVLVSLARQGKFVVRLKGGDPFVFGRGGEEMLACISAGIACEVVPGVTSAIAVPAAAGIPVTHRAVSRQFTVATAHDDLDWSSLAATPGTLVLLMGATRVEHIAGCLMAAGANAETPVAIVENGTTAAQRTTRATLRTIAAAAALAEVAAPAVIIVGQVAALEGAQPGDLADALSGVDT